MSRVRGRSFKITKNQASGYGYARAAYRRNPGVTTIAAINGRGSYAGSRSARSVMGKLKRNARKVAARRTLTAAKKRAFVQRMAAARGRGLSPNRSTSSAQSASSKRNIKKAQDARRAWGQRLKRGKRVRVGRASYGRKPKARRLKAGVYIANRRKKAGKKTMARRRRKRASSGATKKRRRSSKRRRKSSIKTSAPKRRRRRKSRKAAAGKRRSRKRGSARRRRRSKLAAPRRRRRRAKAGAPRRRRRRAKAGAPRRRRRRAKAGAPRRRRRRAKAGAPRRRRRRKGSARRAAPRRRRRRGSRKVAQHMQAAGRRGQYKLNRRRRHRRNGRRLFRRNGAGDFLKMGAMLFAGFGLHRLLTNLIDRQVLSRLLPAPAPTPAATSGFSLQENRGLIASVVVGGGTAFLASKVIKNAETRKLILGGIAVSTVQGIIMSLLKAFAPPAADMLAGPEDGTAARLSAMYGLGAGASIMPRYAPINGLGEYFREPMNGLGEYFREPMNGLGEYFREPMNGIGEYIAATNGLGTYEQNGDLYQAAAGMGNHDYNGNHIDPSGDLDRQLTIAEAAAGVGALSPFEAAAGIGPMQAAAGFGAIDTVPSADTWIPGSADGQLWAGVRAVTAPQSATEMVPAGVLQTDGGQGIFG